MIFHSEVHVITLSCLFVYTTYIHSEISLDLGSALAWKASWQYVNYSARTNMGFLHSNEPMMGQGLGESLPLGKQGFKQDTMTKSWRNRSKGYNFVLTGRILSSQLTFILYIYYFLYLRRQCLTHTLRHTSSLYVTLLLLVVVPNENDSPFWQVIYKH